MSDSNNDDEFDAYLKRRASLQKGAPPPEHLEPPPELDRIVIGNARKAIQGASPMHLYRAPKWALPAALAAIIIISFVVMLDLGVRAQRAQHSSQAVQAAAPAEVAPTSPFSGQGVQLQPRIPTTPWPPAPARARKDATGLSDRAPTADGAAPQASAEKARTRLARAEVAATRSRARAPASSPDRLDPATWVTQIEKLRSAGQTAEAEREIKSFRTAYPDYPLPQDAASPDGRTQ